MAKDRDVTSGNATRSGRVPSIKNVAITAMKSLAPKTRKRISKAVLDSDEEASMTSSQPPKKKSKGLFKFLPGMKKVSGSASENGDSDKESVSEASVKSAHQPSVIEVSDDNNNNNDEHDDETPEAQLERMMENWNSPIYAFFHPVPTIEKDNDGRIYHKFHCFAKSCKASVKRYPDTKDNGSTSNLRKHAKACWGVETIQAAMDARSLNGAREVLSNHKDGSIAAAFQVKGKGKVTYSLRQHTREQTRIEIVRWVSESVRPFSVVKDRSFKSLMKTGRPEYYLPSPTTVARDVRQVFARSRQRIASILRKYEGKIHFATDAWTSPNHRAFVCLTVHLEHKGVPISMILDLVEVPKSHTGVNLAIAFANILKDFGLSDKVLSITCDNATNNDVMITELEDLLAGFSKLNHTRCFLHVNNLVGQTFVRQFDAPKAPKISSNPDDPDNDPDSELYRLAEEIDLEERETQEALLNDLAEGEAPESDDDEGWVDEMAALSQAEREVLLKSLRPVKVLLAKVQKLAYKTINSTTLLLPAWHNCLEELKMTIRNIPRDVRTRWNSTYDMLYFVLEHKKAYKRFTADGSNGLREFEMDEEEWEVVEQLCEILEVLKDATLFFSRSTPSLANVIPIMDIINDRLTTAANDFSLSPAIRTAAGLAKKMLNRYYSRTDEVETYRIAMILHPQYKLQYFKDAKWESSWISTAEDIFRAEYEANYRKFASSGEKDTPMQSQMDSTPSTSLRKEASSKKKQNMFDNLLKPTKPSADPHGEVERYLSADTEAIDDPIAWWSEHRTTYPSLSRMALDYLTIPATSVDVERAFSRGRLILSHIRNRLSAQSTRALLCLGNWSLLGEFIVKDSDVLVAAKLPDIDEEEEEELEDGWDSIIL